MARSVCAKTLLDRLRSLGCALNFPILFIASLRFADVVFFVFGSNLFCVFRTAGVKSDATSPVRPDYLTPADPCMRGQMESPEILEARVRNTFSDFRLLTEYSSHNAEVREYAIRHPQSQGHGAFWSSVFSREHLPRVLPELLPHMKGQAP